MALQRLKEAAERAKHELSSASETDINLPFIAAATTVPSTSPACSRATNSRSLCEDLLERLVEPCRRRSTTRA